MKQAILKKLTVLQLAKKFSTSYGTLRPILHSQQPPHLSLSATLQTPTVRIKQAYRQCCWTWLYEQYYYSGPEILF
jgi:hypothetical protein